MSNEKISICSGWFFAPRELKNPDPVEMEAVRIPHTAGMIPLGGASARDCGSISTYLRDLEIPAAWEGKRILLRFEGCAHRAQVYVNGTAAAVHCCAFTEFAVDLTDLVSCGGKSRLTVRLDSRADLNQPPFGPGADTLPLGGIFRSVWLECTEREYLDHVFVSGDAEGVFRCSFTCSAPEGLMVHALLYDAAGREVQNSWESADRPFFHRARTCRLWEPDDPVLYTLELRLTDMRGGRGELQRVRVRFGFRSLVLQEDGLYLNGQLCHLTGLGRFQAYPWMGYAAPARAQRRDAEILRRELGVNAVWTADGPPDRNFLDRCDETGLLVCCMIPSWQAGGDEAYRKQVRINAGDTVRQCRNHPSVILWEICREDMAETEEEFCRELGAVMSELDSTRPSGISSGFLSSGGIFPRRGSAETTQMVFAGAAADPGDPAACAEQAMQHAQAMQDAAKKKKCAGMFGWCMQDIQVMPGLGRGDGMLRCGVMDSFRNPKAAAAVYASQRRGRPVLECGGAPDGWIGGAAEPWIVCSNCDRVRLLRNGREADTFLPAGRFGDLRHPPFLIPDSIGKLLETEEGFAPQDAELIRELLLDMARHGGSGIGPVSMQRLTRLMLRRSVTMQDLERLYRNYVGLPGSPVPDWRLQGLRDGRTVIEKRLTPDGKTLLQARVDTLDLIDGDSWDMASVRIRAVDASGALQRGCCRAVTVTAEGAVRRVGPAAVVLRGGMAGCYAATDGRAGSGTLRLEMDGADPVTVGFTVRKESPT